MKLEKKDDRKIILGKSGLKFDPDSLKSLSEKLENSIGGQKLLKNIDSDNKKNQIKH